MRRRHDTEPLRAPADDPAAIERSLAFAFEATPAGMVLTDLDGRILRVNDAFCELIGYPHEILVGGMTLRDVTHPDDESPDRPDRRAAIADGAGSYRVEKRFIQRRRPGHLDRRERHGHPRRRRASPSTCSAWSRRSPSRSASRRT